MPTSSHDLKSPEQNHADLSLEEQIELSREDQELNEAIARVLARHREALDILADQ